MRTVVIVNPAAGSAVESSVLEELVARRDGWTLLHTRDTGDAKRFAAEAVEDGDARVVACGGDGTINEIVQGLMRHPDRARLAIVPLGTANDLARTLDVPADPEGALGLLDDGDERSVDIVRVETGGHLRYCINVAAGGFSGEVDRVIDAGELKQVWGPFAYLAGAVEAAGELQPYETVLEVDDEPPETVSALAVTVANGRTCGGGLRVAPWADMEDGLVDVTVVRFGTALELTGLAARLASGPILESSPAVHRRGRRVRLRSEPKMWFNVDGEIVTDEPLGFTVVPRALRVTVGPAYWRDPIL